ncbi:hypothetical protein BDY21DRAFT_369781 [Lineolata rhizophorae]|uniref:Uncharacterized protein n=1 Tax=Lineolata rhizophorae TaxID=578093 RepID=A0A6A6P7P4_9PEZI|nr:hypothetical protein BDY21DRAFT_369781 [Lineolata rhizophorae]
MRVAEILSDLTSLRVCDPSAAFALVSARPSPSRISAAEKQPDFSEQSELTTGAEDDDEDLRRAKDLVELHYKVKVGHADGRLDHELAEMRESVQKAVAKMAM